MVPQYSSLRFTWMSWLITTFRAYCGCGVIADPQGHDRSKCTPFYCGIGPRTVTVVALLVIARRRGINLAALGIGVDFLQIVSMYESVRPGGSTTYIIRRHQ